ncbi:hypothetical protein ME7_00809 [Bartonella birtlesii LL-WM9]|uniref:Uncharacterized protein n=1 Tax=Bartonella birtlesii LL-WM9 TaxID=1094552 RepID=J0Q253_9HYPH|nr:hypothetical protein ME7_00809 [Bartonella birtlesii LL-WM9]
MRKELPKSYITDAERKELPAGSLDQNNNTAESKTANHVNAR